MENYKQNLDIAKALSFAGFNILEVEICGMVFWYNATNFEKGSYGAIQNTPYCSFIGQDITSIIENAVVSGNIKLIAEKLKQKLQAEPKMRMEFSANHTWRYLSID